MLLDKTVSFHGAHDKPRMQDAAALRERAQGEPGHDEELAKLLPVRVTIVEIELADGSLLTERITAVRGTPRNPMTRTEVIDKARDLTAPVLGRDKSDQTDRDCVRDRIRGRCSQPAAAAAARLIPPHAARAAP